MGVGGAVFGFFVLLLPCLLVAVYDVVGFACDVFGCCELLVCGVVLFCNFSIVQRTPVTTACPEFRCE